MLSALLFAFASLQSAPTAPAQATLPPGVFGWMGELAGHCWSSRHPDGMRDTQCYTAQFGRYLRGTIEIVAPEAAARPPYRGDSVFVWDPERAEIHFWFWSSAGNHGRSVGRVEGDRIIFPSLSLDEQGRPRSQTVWTRLDAQRFRVERQALGEAAVQPAPAFIYVRDEPARASGQ